MDSIITTISPEAISLICTYKCTAKCIDCCFKCSPSRIDRLSFKQMVGIIDEATTQFSTIKIVVITGGECFTIGEELYELITYIHSKNLQVRIVTNGYWANSIEKSNYIIERLIDCRLNEINFSTGDCHQQWIPLDFVINGIIASIEHHIYTVVNVETNDNFSFTAKSLQTTPRLFPYNKSPYLKILSGIWISSHTALTQNVAKMVAHSPKRCKQLFKVLTVTPNKELTCCCGLTITTHSFLRLGIIKKGNIRQLWNSQFNDFLKIWLYTEGPEKIMQFVNDYDPTTTIPNVEQLHICGVCHYIFTNQKIITILQNNYKKVLPRILLKYIVLSTTKNELL